jgi:hypothetical protein
VFDFIVDFYCDPSETPLACVLLWMQRKESPMDHGQLSMVADKFQWVFSEVLLNACGKEAKFCRRQRTITPFRLGLALTATCASHRVDTLADFHRGLQCVVRHDDHLQSVL